MNLYIIDFETTFSKENTLTNKSIEEYVRHPKFEVIGCGINNLQTGVTEWHDGGYIQDFSKDAVCCHHAQFDGFILNHVYGIKPAFWYDTLSMSRAIYPRLEKHSLEALVSFLHLGSPKSVPYNQFRGFTLAEIEARPDLMRAIGDGCSHDIELTHKLFDFLKPQMPESELELIDETIRLYTEPLLEGNQELLGEALQEAVIARETKMYELGVTDNVLRSSAKFSSLLRGAGLTEDELPTKTSPRTGKSTYAFAKSDIEFLNLREHESPLIRDIVEARLAAQTSIHETRAGRLLAASERGPLPVYLRYYGAHTGRPSGGDKLNFLNLPRGSKLRAALEAPGEHALVWADASQIECRTTAILANCAPLLNAFRDGRDVYSEFGQDAFRCDVSKTVNQHLRFFSKETVLGCGYGMGKEKFYKYLQARVAGLKDSIEMLTRDETDNLIDTFRKEYWEIPKIWKELDYIIKQMHGSPTFELDWGPVSFVGRKCILPNGLFLDYDGLWQDEEGNYRIGKQKLWGGALLENIVQALARIMISDVWLDLKNEGACVLWVYDELVFCVPLREEQAFKAKLEGRMRLPPGWLPGIPLDCEVDSGPAYGKGAWKEAV